jgi:hypothetical protein
MLNLIMKTKLTLRRAGALAAGLIVLPMMVQAQQIFQYATGAGTIFYTTNNGAVAIQSYSGNDTTLAIPNTITALPVRSIGSAAFYQNFTLTSVTIGTNVTTLADQAFFYCPLLAGATIPASVTNIGLAPFVDCKSLTVIAVATNNPDFVSTNGVLYNKARTSLIEFPGGVTGTYNIAAAVTNVGSAFIGNTLTNITVDAANANYAGTNGVLFDKSRTYLITYPGGLVGGYAVPTNVTTIVSAAFEYGAGITNVSIGTNVTSIGQFAFYDCANLLAITVNPTNHYYSSLNSVLFDKYQTDLIQYPSGLAGSYIVPSTATNIESGAFGDSAGLVSVVIPDSVRSLGVQTFYSCQNLVSISLGNGLTSIGQQAFNECTSLADLAIPNSVTNIGSYAFYYCPGLVSVTFGTGLKSLGLESFGDCQSLSYVCFSGNQPVDGGSVFYFDMALTQILYVSGTTGWGGSYDSIPTAPCPTCGSLVAAPPLGIIKSGTNVVVGWPVTATGFTLLTTTNLVPPVVWATDAPAPAIFSTYFVVTNSFTGPKRFYRLKQ